MTPAEWRAVKDLFERCLDAPPELRAALLSDSTVTAEVRTEAVRLLRNLEAAGPSFLKPPEAFRRAVFAAAPTLEQGEVLAGRFRVERFLGRGGMGEVYEAFDTELNDRVALKLLVPDLQDDPAASARMRRELQLARRVTHPNVCRLFDLARHEFPWGEREFLSMELLEGDTLAAKVKNDGPLPAGAGLALLKQIAKGLEAAHLAGVVHRDLKPSNIMLTPAAEGTRAVLMDFGLARRHATNEAAVTQTGQIAGTFDYMAPELLAGGAASVASDLFALGKVTLFMATGSLSIDDPRLAEHWKAAIKRALDPDPERRFKTGGEFVAALEKATVTRRLPALSRRELTAGGVAAGLALVGGTIWLLSAHAAGREPAEAVRLYETGVDQIRAGSYFAATRSLDRAVNVAPHFALAHARLAEAWIGLQIPEKATREMLLARRDGPWSLSDVDRLQFEGIDLTVTRDFAAAAAKYEQLRSKGGAEFDLDLGRAYERANRIADAKEKYRQVAASSPRSAAAWLRLAVLRSRTGEAGPAIEAFSQAERIYQTNNDLEGLVELTRQRGSAAARRGDYREAKAQFAKARDTARLAANVPQEVSAILQFAAAAYGEGDAALAEQNAREGLELAQRNQMQALAVVGVVNLGNAFAVKYDFASAEKFYRDGLAMARNEALGSLAALCVLSLATLHDQQKRETEAESEAREALAYYQPNGYAYETARGAILIGRYQRDRGMYAEATENFKLAAAMAEKAQDRVGLAIANSSLGSVLESQERFWEALAAYRRNLDSASDEESRGYAALQAGGMLWRLGRFDEGAQMLMQAKRAGAKFPDLALKADVSRAAMALDAEQPEQAVSIAELGLSNAANRPSPSATQLKEILGLALLRRGNLAQGSRLCEQALVEAAKLEDRDLLVAAQLGALQARVLQADATRALKLFREMEPFLEQRPETKWRALAWIARADHAYAERAQGAFDDLKRLWGEPVWSSYSSSPEVRRLAMSLSASRSR